MQAVQVTEFGGPEVLRLREVPDPVVPRGALLVDVEAAGVNLADTHALDNSYVTEMRLPFIPGTEVAGRAADGRRVVALVPSGGYAERAVAWPALTFAVPDDVDCGVALGLLVQGVTAWHVLHSVARLREGEVVAVHGAAGGVGGLAVQLARDAGARRVIATASTAAKRDAALALGADVAIDSQDPAMANALVAANDGEGIDVVLEVTAGKRLAQSLAALAPFGRAVLIGNAARERMTPVAPDRLIRGTRGLHGFWLNDAIVVPGLVEGAVRELMRRVRAGTLRVPVGARFDLADAAGAHRRLLAREAVGKLVLDVAR